MAGTLSGPEDIDTVDGWIRGQEFRSTAELKIPERLVDQVIGQESAVEVIIDDLANIEFVNWT